MMLNVVVFDDVIDTKTYFHFASEVVLEIMFGTKDWLSDKAELLIMYTTLILNA